MKSESSCGSLSGEKAKLPKACLHEHFIVWNDAKGRLEQGGHMLMIDDDVDNEMSDDDIQSTSVSST